MKEAPDNQEYIENQLEAILSQGRTSDIRRFIAKFDALKDEQKTTPHMVRLRAQAAAADGKSEQALALLKAFVESHPKIDINNGPLVHAYVDYGDLLQDRAEFAAAAGIYTQVSNAVEGNLPADSEAAVAVAMALYEGSRLNGESKQREVMNQLARVRNEDQTYWPAMLAEARVLLDAHNEDEAGQAVAQVLDLNPNELTAMSLQLVHSIAEFNFDAAQAQLANLKKRSDGADVSALEGRMLLSERLPEQALAPLLDAVRKNPDMPEARGWLAADYYFLNEHAKMEEQLSAIKVSVGGGRHPVTLLAAGDMLRQLSAARSC